MSKGSLKIEKNEVKKNRREVSKWVRKQGLKYGSGQNPYQLYRKVIILRRFIPVVFEIYN